MSAVKEKTKKMKREKAKGVLFEGAVADKIPVIERQCARLVEARAELGKARLAEKEIQAKMIELFKSEDPPIKMYRHEASGKVFKLDETEKVTFKAAPKAGDGNGINPDSGDGDEGDELEETEEAAE